MVLKQYLRALVMAGAVTAVSLAAAAPAVAQNLSGSVSGTGQISVDGQVISGRASVGSGSTIATGADADATVDLGGLGKLQMRPNTTIQLTVGGGGLQMMMALCGSVTQTVPQNVSSHLVLAPAKKIRLAVISGNVSFDQENGDRKTFSSGSQQTLLYKVNSVGVSSTGAETAFTVTCSQGNFFDKVRR